MPVCLKRIYEPASRSDGVRVLVDRLWPRGLSKARAAVDEWLRGLAPSHELRQWFHAQPQRWVRFRQKYLKELVSPDAEKELQKLYAYAHRKKRLTLLFASKNEKYNNATVLKELLEGMRKPPTGAGHTTARAMRHRAAAMRRR